MRSRLQKTQRLLGSVLFVCLLSFLSTACGAPSTVPSPTATATGQLDTGPKGLPLYCPYGMAFDTQGNIYIADNDPTTPRMRLVKLSPTG